MKNISMSTKQIKFNEESLPSNRHSDADIESKIQPMWRPSSEHYYKPVTPNFAPSPQHFMSSQQQAPAAPPSRPKFEPIDKPMQFQQAKKVEQPKVQPVYKPTPVTPSKNAFSNFIENSSQQESNQTKSYYYSSTGPQSTTTYYTGVAGPPIHHNAVAHETSNSVHMKESTEKSHRVVNMTQTRRVISLDPSKKEEEKLEPFPYTAEPGYYYSKQKVPPPPTPNKFIRGEFRESDYDSERESTRIRPVWTPTGFTSDSDEPHYRRVRPPSSRSSSVPPSSRYERVMTPMEFDREPVMMPSRINMESPSQKTPQQYFASALYRDQLTETLDRHATNKKQSQANVTRDDIGIQFAPQTAFVDNATNLNTAFKTKAHQFMKDVINDQQRQQQKPILKKANSVGDQGGSQAYREESRVSQYGEL